MALGQMRHRGQEALIGALGDVGRGALDQLAPHAIDVALGLDAVTATEQAGEAGMRDGDVQPVRIIVGDVLPVDRARAHRDAAERAQLLEAVGVDHRLIGRHHRGDRGAAGFEAHEDEAAPDFHFDRHEAALGHVERGIVEAIGHARQPTVEIVGPGVIRADQLLGTAAVAIDQPRAAVAADVCEGAHRIVGAADDEDALAEEIERVPIARRRNVADVAHDLPARTHHPRHLDREVIGIMIEPGGQAPIGIRIGVAKRNGAGHAFATPVVRRLVARASS